MSDATITTKIPPGWIGCRGRAGIGALFFGHLTELYGRKRLFMVTLVVYLIATVATAFAFAPWSARSSSDTWSRPRCCTTWPSATTWEPS